MAPEDNGCETARQALWQVERFEKATEKKQAETDVTIQRIFDRLDALSGRWLAVAGAVIILELGLIGFLCKQLFFAG